MERLLSLYVNGFSNQMLGLSMTISSNPEKLDSDAGRELISNLEQGISEFLIEMRDFSTDERANFGPILPAKIKQILVALRQKDWKSYNAATEVLNACFDGMETALSLISKPKDAGAGQ